MQKLITSFLLLAMMTTFCQGQNMDRFIRIVGNAKHNYESTGMTVNLSVSEIQPNEYKKIMYKPLDKVYAEFVTNLKEIGINETELIRNTANLNKYSKTLTKDFSLPLNDQEKLSKLAALNMDGVKITGTEFSYDDIDPEIETQMALSCIADAKRKAKRICDEIGKKVGKILNIEDSSSGCCGEIPNSKKSSTLKTYKVKITFELED